MMIIEKYRTGISNIYDYVKSEGVTEQIFMTLQSLDIDSLVDELLEKKQDKTVIEQLTYILHEVYNKTGDVFISDDKYDSLYALNKDINNVELAGSTVHTLKKYPHKYPMLRGTVEKVHYVTKAEKPIINDKTVDARKSYEEWITAIEKRTGISMDDKEIRCSLKVDGVSGIIELEFGICKRALKRGDVDNNEAEEILILRNRSFPDMKKYGECGLKSEIYMSYDKFEEFKNQYGEFNSPRSAVTSIVNADEVDDRKLEYITIFDLEIYSDGESIMPENIYHILPSATNYEAIAVIVDELERYAEKHAIPADGVVIRIMDKKIQELLGRDGGVNKFEVGFKFKPKKYKARLKKVNFSMGKGGSYTPVAEIDPIVIKGNEITNISLGSIPRLAKLDLRIGQTVLITYDVIPYLYDCDDDKHEFTEKVSVPTHCESCGEPLKYQKSRLLCDNDDCDMVKYGRILNYAVKVGMEGIADETVSDLMEYLDIREIYQLYDVVSHRMTLLDIRGYDEISVDAIIESIELRRKLPLDLVIGSLSIPNVGRGIMQKILNKFSNEEFLKMLEDGVFYKLTDIRGIGDSVVNSLTKWRFTKDNYKNLKELFKRIEILEPTKTVDSHTILFTKVRDYEFQSFLESKGYGIVDKYTKDVDVVIYGDESKKTEKARKDGKLLMTLPQAYEMYGYMKG